MRRRRWTAAKNRRTAADGGFFTRFSKKQSMSMISVAWVGTGIAIYSLLETRTISNAMSIQYNIYSQFPVPGQQMPASWTCKYCQKVQIDSFGPQYCHSIQAAAIKNTWRLDTMNSLYVIELRNCLPSCLSTTFDQHPVLRWSSLAVGPTWNNSVRYAHCSIIFVLN